MTAETVLDRALAQALDRAASSRHDGALHLACQLRDNRIPRTDAEATMRAYAACAPSKSDPYTEREAVRVYRSVLARSPREPWGDVDPMPVRVRQTEADRHRIETQVRIEGTEAGDVHPEWAEALRASQMSPEVERAHFAACRAEERRCVAEAAEEPSVLDSADEGRLARLLEALPEAFDRAALFGVARALRIRDTSALRLRRHLLASGAVRPCPLGWCRKVQTPSPVVRTTQLQSV
ncbi:MAG: hypothetical protein AAF845_05590 [Bacteroidota bacterium]